jgi:hypothetical protein
MAIAQAVQSRLEAETQALGERSRALSDSLRITYERAFADSIGRVIAEIRANAVAMGERSRSTFRVDNPSRLPPPKAGERRVVIVPFSQSQNGERVSSSRVGDELADSIRTLLSTAGTHAVVDESTTRDVARAGRGVPTMIGTMLDAPAVVTGTYQRRRDSLVVRMQVTCLTCGGLAVREVSVPLSSPMDAVSALQETLIRDLGRVRWVPISSRGSGRAPQPIPLPPGTRVVVPPPAAPPPL